MGSGYEEDSGEVILIFCKDARNIALRREIPGAIQMKPDLGFSARFSSPVGDAFANERHAAKGTQANLSFIFMEKLYNFLLLATVLVASSSSHLLVHPLAAL